MNNSLPFVSIIIPCRNERDYLPFLFDSIISQDYPEKKMEVLIIDGMSEDRTREIIEKFKIKNLKLKIELLDNPKRVTPYALNIGIKKAKGEVIIRMDAHSTYPKDYVSKCVRYLREYSADNVGGIMKTLPSKNTLTAKAIAICLSHPFGSASDYRKGSVMTKEVDTVFGGCYRKEVFQKIGLFNENLIRSQDLEFNLRLKRAGGKILLVPDIICYYYPKSNLKDFFLHNFEDGFWAIYPLKFNLIFLRPRHYIPLIFILILIFSFIAAFFSPLMRLLFLLIVVIYFLETLLFSLMLSLKKGFRYFLILPLVFICRHFGYGLGSLWGLIRLIK